MKKSGLIGQCLLIAASAFLLPSISFAADPQMPASSGMTRQSLHFDWVKHTQQTLDDLQAKLNLKPEQKPAWEAWAKGVITDANEQVKKKSDTNDEDENSSETELVDQTTPQRMAKGIARLRAHTDWMQAHLVRLDAAQVRTKTFYDTLEPEQKTIFDLFWTVMHHTNSDLQCWKMPMHRLGPPMEEEQNETSEQ
jgi:hypothetical protein